MSVMYSGAVDWQSTPGTALKTMLEKLQQRDGEFLVGIVDPSDKEQLELMVINLSTMRSRVYVLLDGWEQLLANDLSAGFFTGPGSSNL